MKLKLILINNIENYPPPPDVNPPGFPIDGAIIYAVIFAGICLGIYFIKNLNLKKN
jgi:hypothetical protein